MILNGLLCTLRAYQTLGVKYILHQRKVLLADEMGLGKTVRAIATMVSLRNTNETHFLVVCPASVITNWCREIVKHSKLNVVKIHGQDKERAFSYWRRIGGVGVTTYETTKIMRYQYGLRFGMLVVDEAHYIKNRQAQRTQNPLRRFPYKRLKTLDFTGFLKIEKHGFFEIDLAHLNLIPARMIFR